MVLRWQREATAADIKVRVCSALNLFLFSFKVDTTDFSQSCTLQFVYLDQKNFATLRNDILLLSL